MMRGGMGAGRGGGGMAGVKPVLTLADVQGWLEKQQPFVLQTVMKTCTNLLVTKHDVPAEDLTDWYSAAEAAGDAVEEEQTKVVSPPVLNKGTLLSGGIDPNKSSNMLNRNPKPGLAWTRSDMRHPHKVTAQMKPLPEMDIIPPFSAENKEQKAKREELLKTMIGEAPKGRPHASGIKEDDIDLVDAESADVDERMKKHQKKRESDNEEDEHEEDDDDDGAKGEKSKEWERGLR